MKKTLLASALSIAALIGTGTATAQNYVPFEFYGFQNNHEASFDRTNYQRYVVGKMMHNPDEDNNNWFIQRLVPVFDSNEKVGSKATDWAYVVACFMRDDVLYGVRNRLNLLNQIVSFDGQGNVTNETNIAWYNGYITHAAYVEEDDMVYMILSTSTGSSASLYKAPGTNMSDITFVETIANSFEAKPYSFTYVKEKGLFYYVTNSGYLYSLTKSGLASQIYNIHAQGALLPDGDETIQNYGSGLVWAEPYNCLIWTHERTGGWCYWYTLDPNGTSGQLIINDQASGTSASLFNCMMNTGLELPKGVPATPGYLSCYPASGKSGYYDLSWPAIYNDVDGNELEEEVTYEIYISEHLVATASQPKKGKIASVRFLLPHAWTQDTFYVHVVAVTKSGKSGKAEAGPITSKWDPENPGGWITVGVEETVAADFNVNVNGGLIEVTGLNGAKAQIVAIDGKVMSVLSNDGAVELPAGLYIVNAGNKSVKVLVK